MASSSRDVQDDQVVQTRNSGDVDGNGMAIASLVVGMLAATMAFLVLSSPGAVLFGLIAIGLGIAGLGKANRFGGLHKGLAISGIVSGLLGLLVGAAVIAGLVALGNEAQERLQDPAVQDRLQDVQSEVEEAVPDGR